MKYTRPLRLQAAAPCAALLALLPVFSVSANPFNDGATHSIVTDTVYDETLYVGIQKPGNTLLIDSNATVSATEVVVGQLTASSNNTVAVVGGALLIAGSASTNGLATGGVVVGSADDGAALSINNASTLGAEHLYVGMGTNDSGQVDLAGEGTALNIVQDALVGTGGSDNSIEIGDGAAFSVGGVLTVGDAATSNNAVNVASGGTLFVNGTNSINVVNTDGDNGIAVSGNGTLQVGGDVETGTLESLGVTLSKNAILEAGGTLKLSKNKIDGGLNVILNDALSTNTASWTSASVTSIGGTGSDNSLTFTNGATGHALQIVQLGQGSASARNQLNVGGSNSLFTAAADIFVGAQGDKNELNIADGGQVDVAGTLYLGNNSSASGNEVNVSSNGTLTVGGGAVVGDAGASNTFTLDNGSVQVDADFILGSGSAQNRYNQTGGTAAVDGGFIIGKSAGATGKTGFVNDDSIETTGNLAIVGSNAVLNILQDLTVGQEGGGSILAIRDGGAVHVDGDVTIGEAVGDNYIYLQRGSNTQLTVAGDLVVGIEGDSNRFAAYGGTADIGGDFYLGASTNQHTIKNFIHLETTNAVLNVAGGLYIGASNSLNTLDIVDGAAAHVNAFFVGAHEGVSNNWVTITGEKSLLEIASLLTIGSTTGMNNTVTVEDGGILSVEQSGIVIGTGTNNLLTIGDGGILKSVDWDFAAMTNTATNIVFESGASLQLLGMLTGTNMVTGGIGFILDGTNAVWDTGTNLMVVGDADEDNLLRLTNGAYAATASNLLIGRTAGNNTVEVSGGSALVVGNDLLLGNEDDFDSAYNTLSILDGGMLLVSNNVSVVHVGTVKIGSTGRMTVLGDYTQDQYSSLEIGISSNQVEPNLIVEGTAAFADSADKSEFPLLKIYDEGISASNIVTIVRAGNMTVGGAAASSGNIRDNIATNLLLGFNVTVSNGTGYTYIVLDDFIQRTIGDAGNLDGQLLAVADEITLLDSNGDSNAVAMTKIIADMSGEEEVYSAMDSYYGEKKSSVPAHNAVNLGVQSVAEQLTRRADNTRARMGRASTGLTAPSGVEGPHMADQQLQGWFTGFRTWADRSADEGYDAYDGTIGGILIGADATVAEGILVGVAGGSARSALDKSNGGQSDTRTIFGTAYASAGTEDWFADASFIFGSSRIDYELGSVFDTSADYDAQNMALYVGGGKEIAGSYLIITPQASLLGNYYTQDSYEENSTSAVARRVDSFNTFYLQSSVGCNLGFYTALGDVVLRPDFRAFWLHEFNAREEDLSYSLVGGTGSYNLQLQAPVSDILKLGGGLSARLGEYLELRADLDARMAGSYSDYTLLGSIRYQF